MHPNKLMKCISMIIAVCLMPICASAATGDITTVAGTSADMNTSFGVIADGAGNLYISDYNRIRKVDAAGNITTIAGTGVAGFSGDGGAATAAQLSLPAGVAIDSTGNLYIADYANHRIRKIDTGGNISTYAGTGVAGFSGDGAAASAAQLSLPAGVAIDSTDNLYIAERGNHRIRKVDAVTGNISTYAGTGVAGYSGDGAAASAAQINGPYGLTLDSADNLYIVEWNNQLVRKVDAATGIISTYAGTGAGGYSGDGGPATAAQLAAPSAITADSANNIYITDAGNHRVRKVDATTGNISTVAGTGVAGLSGDGGAATAATLNGPNAVTTDSAGNLYILDNNSTASRRIRKVDTTGVITSVVTNFGFSGDGGLASAAQFYNPYGLDFDVDGNLYIADFANQRIRKVDTAGNISTIAGTGVAGFSGDNGPASAARLNNPYDVTVDIYGNLFIADEGNHRIRKIDTNGNITTVTGTGIQGYNGDGIAATSANLNAPAGISLDINGNLYIADWYNHRVRKVDAASGLISTVAGTGTPGFNGDGIAATASQLRKR